MDEHSGKYRSLWQWLRKQSADELTMTFAEVEQRLGFPLPASSRRHVAHWHSYEGSAVSRAIIDAGWRAHHVDLQRETVTFSRSDRRSSRGPARSSPSTVALSAAQPDRPDTTGSSVLLVSCVKEKRSDPAPARDLYISPLFRKSRAHAERDGRRWFILSAEHGLVAPDEWLAPYERYLPGTSPGYRTAWGEWVAARLELLVGPLDRVTVEVHASEAYVAPIREPLARRGATLETPLAGLPLGNRLSWYDQRAVGVIDDSRDRHFTGDIAPIVSRLGDPANSVSAAELTSLERRLVDGPGLYSWYADSAGASDLSTGLGYTVQPGLIYVGQTGASRWPSGTRSDSTLIKRLNSQHLRGRRSTSTLRLTLAAALDQAKGQVVERAELTTWMVAHLRVVPVVLEDADSLGDLEAKVVRALDPPLNLDHVETNDLRRRLSDLRSASAEVP